MPPETLAKLDLFERYDALEQIGMLPDEHRVGEPERHYKEWAPDDYKAVLALFNSWPRFEAADKQMDDMRAGFLAAFAQNLAMNPNADRKGKLLLAADALNTAGSDTFGPDFPRIELDLIAGGPPGYYGGLRPDGKIQINTLKLNDPTVNGSAFSGDLSFIELVVHEATHKVQLFQAEISDGETQDGLLSMRVAEAFYESTAGAKDYNRDLYWLHPFEVQARDFANSTAKALQANMPASGAAPARPLRRGVTL